MIITRLTIFILLLNAISVFGQTESCRKSTEGKDFWFGFMEGRNYQTAPLDQVYKVGHYCEITLSSSFTSNYQIFIGNSTTATYTGTVSANIPIKVWVDWHLVEATGSEVVQKKAIHLVTDNPVNVYALNWSNASSEVALIFPKESLGNEYYAMCYTPHINGNGINTGSGRNSEFLVVASEDNTTVNITPSKVTDQNKPAGIPFQITLNKGEVYQVQSENLPIPKWPGQGDLTGSYIRTDKPIAFYSGSLSTTVPGDASVSAWDHLYEQMPPMQTWGRKFITVPLKTISQDYYRVIASQDNTEIRVGNAILMPLLKKGEFREFILKVTEPSLIESDKPILLAQFSASNSVDRPPGVSSSNWDGDPFMVIVSSVDQIREKVAFVAYDSPLVKSKFFINIVVKNDASGCINLVTGSAVDPVVFTPLGDTGYSYAQVAITPGNHVIESTVSGKGFIAYVYGFGGVEAYGYGVGYNLDIVLDLGSNINAIGKLLVRCDGDPPMTLNAGNAFDNYLWSTGETTSTIQVSQPGWYKVKASIVGGCGLQDSVELQVSKPSIFLGRDTTICNPANIVLDASDQFTSFLWSTAQTSQNINVSSPGAYKVDAINKYGCKASDEMMVSFTDKPRINLSKLDTLMCGKYTTTLDISADKTVNWKLESIHPNKVSISNLTASVLPADEGTYPFILTAKDEFSCASTADFNLGFYHSPVVNLGRDTTICNPENIILNAGAGFASYLWSTAETAPVITVKNDGLYSVNVIDVSGCKTSDEMKVSFTNRPKIDLSKLETLICGKFTTTLNISADKSVNWIVSSDPKVGFNGLTATVLPSDFGTYPVTITAKDTYSCKTDTSFKLGFYKIPKVDFNIEAKKCSGYNLLARYDGDADTVVANFKWVFRGDLLASAPGLSSFLVPLGVNRPQRDLLLKVTQDGCSDSASRNIIVTPKLFMSEKVKLGCEPFNTRLSASNTEVVDYFWDFGDGSPIEPGDSIKTHVYQKANFYTVKVKVVTKEGCANEIKIDSMVHVAPIPTAGFTTFPVECLDKGNHEISYVGTGDNLDTYNWDLSNFNSEEIIQNPKITKGPLIFNLKNRPLANIKLQVVSKYGCKSDTAKVLVKRIPAFSISASSYAGCTPFEPLFTATTGDPVDQVNYNWSFGDSAIGSGKLVKHIYNIPDQKYDVVLAALSSSTGCADTIKRKEYMWTYPIPTAGFTTLPVECLDKGNHEISYLGTGDKMDTYLWDLSKFDSEEIVQNPDTTQGPLVFKLKNKPQTSIGLRVISKYGCRSDTATVQVKRIPDFTINASPPAGCTPFEPQLTGKIVDSVDQVDFSWNFGDGSGGSGDQVKHEYPEPDHKYDIILSALSSFTGCADTLISKEFVFAWPKPKAAFSMDNKIVYNDAPTVNFLNESTGDKEYLWDFGDQLTSEDKNPSHYYKVFGYRTVLLEVFNEFQCSDTVSHQLLVAFDRIFPPNAFSPNAPNLVDREYKLGSNGIATEGYHLTILSRWNDIVFETKDEIKGWNGQMPNGSMAPAGTYVWILNFSDFLGRRHRQTGTVTLVY